MRKLILGLVSLAITPALSLAPATLPEQATEPVITPAKAEPEVIARIISSPDMFNADIGDIRGVKGYKAKYNTWNAAKAANMKNIFGQFQAENADGYFVAGDLVNGRWTEDEYNTGVFGPNNTVQQARERITRAGNVYYSSWKSFWTDAGIPMSKVYPAVGDHEVGDNPWKTLTLKHMKKFRNVEHYKDVYARHFTLDSNGKNRYTMRPRGTKFEDTAYAQYITPKLLLVTVDVFNKTRTSVDATVNAGQLRWLAKVLKQGKQSGATVVVQAHTPILGPVRTNSSSGLMLQEGAKSAFWRTMRKYDVDYYFAGEVHASTVRRDGGDGPIQISHGTLAGYGPVGFLRMELMSDGSVRFSNRRIEVADRGSSKKMWQTRGRLGSNFILQPFSVESGSMTVSAAGNIVKSSGDLKRMR